MWCSKDTHIIEVHPLGQHDLRVRDELKNAANFTWQQLLIHRVEDCLESTAKSLLRATKKACKAAAEITKCTAQKAAATAKKAARDWWRNHSPAIGVRLAGVALAGLIFITNVSEKLGG